MDSFLKCVLVRAGKHTSVHDVHQHNVFHCVFHSTIYLIISIKEHFVIKNGLLFQHKNDASTLITCMISMVSQCAHAGGDISYFSV